MKVTPDQLVQQLSAVVDPALAQAAVDSYIEMQRRYLAGDWKPTELDGGRLCEAISRALYQIDSGNITHSQMPNEITTKLIDETGTRPHTLAEKDRRHISKAIDIAYKFRSDRGAVHISPTYTANYMDSMFLLHTVKWILADFIRISLNKNTKESSELIEQIVQIEYSLVHELDGVPLVLANDASAPEEVLLLLFNAAGKRLTRAELRGYAVNQKPQTINVAISRLLKEKSIRTAGDNEVALTPVGERRILEKVMPRLAAQHR